MGRKRSAVWKVAIVVIVGTILAVQPSALAIDDGDDRDPGGSDPGSAGVEGYFEGGGVFAGYQTPIVHTSGPGRPNGGGGPKYLCSFFIWDDGVGTDPAHGLIPGHFYLLRCHVEGSDELALNTPIILPYDPANPDGDLIITQPELDEAARNDLEFDAPGIETSPPVDKLVVGFETWFHNADTNADGQPALPVPTPKTASAGTLWATATAQPAFTDFDTGDDQPESVFACEEVIAPFDRNIDLEIQRPDCARYAYQYSSNNDETPGGTYTITAIVTYAVYLQTSANPNLVFQEELQGDTLELTATVTQLQAVIN